MIVPIILSGGSGTRLWPLSTPEKPKQFLPLVTERTLFQETLLRLDGLPELAEPIVVCNESHRFLVAEQLREIGIAARAIVLEPEGRNTAPAIAIAAMLAESGGSDSEPTLLVLPADHVIADAGAFRAAVANAIAAAETGRLVTFGIVPTHAETGFGYIEQGTEAGDWFDVERFVEKPDRETAESYLESGRFLWNSGMFVFRADALLGELERLTPAIVEACKAAVTGVAKDQDFLRLGSAFLESPSDSIDYAVMEKTERAAVVPLDAGWSDVGSWAALYDALGKDADGNVLGGDTVTLDATNCLVLPGGRKLAVLGLDNVVVIDAGETVLVMRKDRSQDLKALVETLEGDS